MVGRLEKHRNPPHCHIAPATPAVLPAEFDSENWKRHSEALMGGDRGRRQGTGAVGKRLLTDK